MGKSMAKSKVIWGEKRSVTLASFSETHFKQIFALIRENIGPGEYVNEAGIRRAVMQAKQNPKMKNGYVKLGLIGSDLVIRAKEKKFLGDIEIDAVAVKSYPVKVKKYAPIKRELERQKMVEDLEKLGQQRKGRELLKTAQRGDVAPVSKPSLRRSGEKPPLPTGPKPVLKPRPTQRPPSKRELEQREKESEERSRMKDEAPPLTRQPSKRELEQREKESEERSKMKDEAPPLTRQPSKRELEQHEKEPEEQSKMKDEAPPLTRQPSRRELEQREKESEERSKMKDEAPPLTRQPSKRELEQQEREVQESREELDKVAQEIEALRKQRLRNVMARTDDEGVTLRDRLLRAAQKAQKLGIGDYAQQRLKDQGLTPMHVDYHGEVLDHQKNRYGRYLKPLWDEYQKHDPKMNFSRWLDAVEANTSGVPGVEDARKLTSHEIRTEGGKVVQSEGVQGGRVTYLNDEQRKKYEARVSKGNVTGGVTTGGEGPIFVIGPDNKLYIGVKLRARAGKEGAFNHSSFFSGGPVKAAGSLLIEGSRIKAITDVSGHYTPTREMIQSVVRKFEGGDQAWLNEVLVFIKGKSSTGKVFMEGEAKRRQESTWAKYSLGALSASRAEKLLTGAEPGSWIVWQLGDEGLYLSHNKGGTATSLPIVELGAQGLERKKLLTQDKLPKETPPTRTSSQRAVFGEAQVNALRQTPAWHANLNTETSAARLTTEPLNAWLLRPSSQGGVVLSIVNKDRPAKQVMHYRINNQEYYEFYQNHARRHAGLMVRP
jgi:hypothetical protein